MFTQRNVQFLGIGSAPVALTADDLMDINVGEVGVFTPDGTRVTTGTAAATPRFIIGYKLPNGKVLTSDVIDRAKIININSNNSAAAAEQIDHVGYNGTAGSIDDINDNLYKLNIYIEEFINSNTDGKKVKFGMHKASLATTQQEIALGLASSLISNFNREPEKFIIFETLNSASTETAGTGTLTVTNNSIIAEASVVPAGVVVGSLVRIGTGTSAPVYEIVNLVGTVITLDRPYQGATDVIASGGANHNYIIPANIGADWGVRLTGQPLSFVVGKQRYTKARWSLNPQDFGATNIFNTANAFEGVGRYEQISELEWFTFGNEGEDFRRGEPTIFSFRDNADPAFGYGVVNITFEDDSLSGFQRSVSPKLYTIVVPDGADLPAYATTTTGTTNLTDVLATIVGLAIADLAL